MHDYKRILAAVDLSADSGAVCARSAQLARLYNAKLHLLHVVEYIPVEPMGEALLPSVEVSEDLVASARNRLAALAAEHSLEPAPREVRVGNIKTEVIHYAEEIGADLVILGSRERHGLAILVNYTEDTILHAAPCDVLAIRVGS